MESVDRHGGAEAVQRIRDVVLELSGTSLENGEVQGRIQATRKILFGETPCFYDLVRVRFPDQEVLQEMIVQGERGTIRTSLSGGPLPPSEVRRRWSDLHRSTLAILKAALTPGVRIDHLGINHDKESRTERLRIRWPGESPFAVDVDPKTGLILRVRWYERPRSGGPAERFEIRYSDFQGVGSLQGIPRQAEVFASGQRIQTRRTETIQVNIGLKPADFE